MKFGVGVDYSLKALLMLADRYGAQQPVRVEEIAETQNIPENYLRRLLIELKRGGLVSSQKGPSGGYQLARSPSRITMEDVVDIIEGGYSPVECLDEPGSPVCPKSEACSMRDVWREVKDSVGTILRRTTLQSLAERRRAALTFSI
ncbi:MAG TPA: Rrf2 family transcriptional regulator [Candidatus Binataceae bacterium]|nr:Rrf2 family transcriptional regulator [Candidatus Binataceae bacterium]